MRFRNIWLVFQREIRDQMRDRRTLFMILVLPLLLYPAMGVGLMQMALIFNDSPRTVVILGNDQLPAIPALIEEGRIAPSVLGDHPGDASLLKLILEDSPPAETVKPDEQEPEKDRTELLTQARELVALSRKKQQIDHWEEGQKAGPDDFELRRIESEIAQRFTQFDAEVVIAFPPGFSEFVQSYLSNDRPTESAETLEKVRPLILFNGANERSETAYKRVAGIMMRWEREMMRLRSEQLEIPSPFLTPLFEYRISDGDRRNVEDVAIDSQHSANFWSRFLPPILILMTLTGAFYPAIDLGAGEKERGTMETLLISPASRSEIVIGKFFTILLFSLLTANLNLTSMGLTGFYAVSQVGGASTSPLGDISLPPISSFVAIGVLMIPLGALFSAMSLALATFAKSSKEGQYYLTPMMIVVMGSTMFCMSPGIELTPFNSVIPVVGLGLMLKSIILSPISDLDVFVYLFPVMITSIGYSLLALWWAVDQFHKEEVLFRESEKFELGLWIKHLLREKEPLPTASQAIFCFATIMILQFMSMGTFQSLMLDKSVSPAVSALRVLAITQLVIIATPALLMGVLLSADVRGTFRLRWPKPKWIAYGLLLPLVLLPPLIELQNALSWFFPPLPEHVQQLLGSMSDDDISIFKMLAVFALAPAICEELAFRGLILSGMARGGRTTIAIIFSALLFGVMHMIPQQVFNAFLQGLVLGLLAIRSGSLLPGVLYHLINNGFSVVSARIPEEALRHVGWLANIGEEGLQFEWPFVMFCAVLGVYLISRIICSDNDHSAVSQEPELMLDGVPT